VEAVLDLLHRFYEPLIARGVTRERPAREAADAELMAA
jgi:hypothetical protein